MSQQELLKRVIHVLNKLKIEYMATGSVASSLQGEPCAIHDIDLVVAIERTVTPKLNRASAWIRRSSVPPAAVRCVHGDFVQFPLRKVESASA